MLEMLAIRVRRLVRPLWPRRQELGRSAGGGATDGDLGGDDGGGKQRTAANAASFEPIRDLSALDQLFSASQVRAHILLLHDPSCPVSRRAYRVMAQLPSAVSIIDVTQGKTLSRAVEQCTGVRHESPQVLVLHRRQAIWAASHGRIKLEAISHALETTASGIEDTGGDRPTGSAS